MRQLVRVTFNGRAFSAYPGDIVLDAALRSGVGVPHDCRSGDCDACLVRVVSGRTEGGDGDRPGTIRACEARAMSDLEIVTDEVARTTTVDGRVHAISPLADDVIEIAIRPARPLEILPGQHLELHLAGHPARAYWPTAPLDARNADGLLRIHVELNPAGSGVSHAFGRTILPGHGVKIVGPFGTAHLRRGIAHRLVLVSHGIGFARTWAMADAALRERAGRSMLVIVGVRSVRDLYMVQALDLMASCPNVRVLVTSEEPQSITPVILAGRPVDYLPPLLSRDVVHAAGPAGMVEVVRQVAAVSGAEFHGETVDAPEAPERGKGWRERLLWPLAGRGKAERPFDKAVPAKPTLETLPAAELARRFRAEQRPSRL